MSLWLDGPYMQGYLRPYQDGPPTMTNFLVGKLENGSLTVHCILGENYAEPSLIYLVFDHFSLSAPVTEGTTISAWSLLPPYGLQAGPAGQYKFIMTAVN